MAGTAESNRIITAILRASSIVSLVLMAVGLGIYLAQGGELTGTSHDFPGLSRTMADAWHSRPLALMSLGVVLLLATPFIRVTAAVFSFLLLEKDLKYALVSLGVLVILAASLFIPGLK